MHLYLIARGVPRELRRFQEDLELARVAVNDGDTLGVGVREVKLYEVAVPKQAMGALLGYIGNDQDLGKWTKFKSMLRTALRLKKLPKVEPQSQRMYRPHVGIHYIGIKEDKNNDDGTEHI